MSDWTFLAWFVPLLALVWIGWLIYQFFRR